MSGSRPPPHPPPDFATEQMHGVMEQHISMSNTHNPLASAPVLDIH